jgi:hypothetical protein
MMHKQKKQRGAAAIIAIVLISAISLAFVVSSSRKSIDEIVMNFQSSKESESFAIAEACLDDTFAKIRKDTNYGLGSGVMNFLVGNGSCDVEVTGVANNRVIVVVGQLDNFYKSIQAEITLTGKKITIDNWQELEN